MDERVWLLLSSQCGGYLEVAEFEIQKNPHGLGELLICIIHLDFMHENRRGENRSKSRYPQMMTVRWKDSSCFPGVLAALCLIPPLHLELVPEEEMEWRGVPKFGSVSGCRSRKPLRISSMFLPPAGLAVRVIVVPRKEGRRTLLCGEEA